jgi:hypothetical protein
MVDMIGDPDGPDHTDVARAAPEDGAPDPNTELGAKQLRRMGYAPESTATRDFGSSRWGRIVSQDGLIAKGD